MIEYSPTGYRFLYLTLLRGSIFFIYRAEKLNVPHLFHPISDIRLKFQPPFKPTILFHHFPVLTTISSFEFHLKHLSLSCNIINHSWLSYLIHIILLLINLILSCFQSAHIILLIKSCIISNCH